MSEDEQGGSHVTNGRLIWVLGSIQIYRALLLKGP